MAAGSGSEGGKEELGRGGAAEAGMAESGGSEATEEGQAMGVANPHEALQGVVTEKDHVHQENSLLQDHLMRLMMRTSSGDNMQIQLDSLEELDEVYDELEDMSQGDFPRRTSSSRMSYNIGSPSSDGRRDSSVYKPSWMRSGHELTQGLSIEEKCDIAVTECKAIQDQMNIYRQESERMLDELQAAYDEAELRTGEIRRDLSDFRREVMADAALRLGKRAIAEKVLKFLEQKVKTTRFTIEKLREHNETLHANIAKTENLLESKKELSDVLHAVDFDQLSIEKQQSENRLRERDKELHRLKAVNLKTIAALEKAQAQLNLLTAEGSVLRATIAERRPQLVRVKDDILRAQAQKARLQEMLTLFIQERDGQLGESQPQVLEYMGLKQKVANLQKVTQVWQNKVEVTELKDKQLKIKIHRMQKH